MTLDEMKTLAVAIGYRIEVSADGNEERLIRHDGTVAVIARRNANPVMRENRPENAE